MQVILVELRGLEPLTPTLPGAGRRRNLARSVANGRIGGVAGTATVVIVVVKVVVRSRVAVRLRRIVIGDGKRRQRSLLLARSKGFEAVTF